MCKRHVVPQGEFANLQILGKPDVQLLLRVLQYQPSSIQAWHIKGNTSRLRKSTTVRCCYISLVPCSPRCGPRFTKVSSNGSTSSQRKQHGKETRSLALDAVGCITGMDSEPGYRRRWPGKLTLLPGVELFEPSRLADEIGAAMHVTRTYLWVLQQETSCQFHSIAHRLFLFYSL